MACGLRIGLLAVATALGWSALAPAAAQDFAGRAVEEDQDDSLYYRQPTYRPNPQAIIHEKAQMRALQRQSRLASMSWYGMSNARPTAAPTPFTSLYSPVWQMPGGRPYAWHSTRWPNYVYYSR